MDVAASEFKVEGQDCYDLGTWYPDAENPGGVLREVRDSGSCVASENGLFITHDGSMVLVYMLT